MTTGVERAEAHAPDHHSWSAADQAAIEPVESFSFHDLIEEEEQSRGIWPTLLAAVLIAAAIGWLGAAVRVWIVAGPAPAACSPARDGFSAPDSLLGMVLFGRSSDVKTNAAPKRARDTRRKHTLEQARRRLPRDSPRIAPR